VVSPGPSLFDLDSCREPARVAALGLAGTGLLALAGRGLSTQELSLLTIAALVLGAAGWVGATSIGVLRARDAPAPGMVLRVRLPLLVMAVVLAVPAWLASGQGVYTGATLALWPTATAAWVLAWWPRNEERMRPSASSVGGGTIAVLAVIASVAAFSHFHQLSSVPPEPTSDHAEKLLDVHDVVGGEHPIFFPRNTGREPAQFYVAAAQVKWLGQPLSWQTLKAGTAAVGVLAVLAIFLVGRELGGRPVGFGAAALAAVSQWPAGVDRIGLRFPYAILASALALWLLLRYVRTGDRRAVLLGGLAIAFGLHGYSPFRVVVLAGVLVFAFVILRAYASGGAWQVPLADAGIACGTILVASIPLVRYAIQHSELVFGRQTSRLDASDGLWDSLTTFADNLAAALLAFNWDGGEIWSVAVADRPLLDPGTGAALLAGVVVLTTIAVGRRSAVAALVLLLVPVLTLGSALNLAFPDENPAANRMGVAAPLVFSIAAVPLAALWSAMRSVVASSFGRLRWAVAAFAAGLGVSAFTAVAATNYESYFRDYRDRYSLLVEHTSEVADAVEALGIPRRRVFLLSYPHWLDARNLGFALGDGDWYLDHNVAPGAPIPPLSGRGRAVYVLAAEDVERRLELRRRHPSGRYVAVRASVEAQDFGLYVAD
jgi:hypothetical protein